MRSFTGHYGIVALLDTKTAERARNLALKFAPHAEYQLDEKHPPYVPLYHAPLREVPEEFVTGLLRAINLVGQYQVVLDRLNQYGPYLFWDSTQSPALFSEWERAHYAALSLVAFLDRSGEDSVRRADLNQAEADNEHHFYHPHVGPTHRPHVTLACNAGETPFPNGMDAFQRARVERFVFALIGPFGRVEKIIDF